jgi:hypothetical protein
MSQSEAREQGKTEFWGYDQHDRSVLDVVDEDEWRSQERWAVDESLGYARVVSDVSSPHGARHWWHGRFMGRFEAMLNDLLHEPLNICTATETVQQSEQITLAESESETDDSVGGEEQ